MSALKMVYYGLLGLNLLVLAFAYKSLEKRHKVFLPLIVFVITIQVAADILKAKGLTYYFLFHIYVPIEYILLSVYFSLLFMSRPARMWLLISNIVLSAFCIAYYYMRPSFWQPDYSHFVISAIFISTTVILFFIKLFKNEEHIDLIRYPDFWINTGNLFFYAGCVFVMGLHFSLRGKNQTLADNLLKINNYLNLLLYLFYLIGFAWTRMNRISSRLSLRGR
jgi:hypothetical protein